MNFLQSYLLYFLPVLFIPLIIHLLNRLRYRQIDWGAMYFISSLSRLSAYRLKLRQFLILLCRVLAMVFLVLAIARPISGAWFDWNFFRKTPEMVIILFDRSASMETRLLAKGPSRRQQAIELIIQTASAHYKGARFVLLENVFNKPYILDDINVIRNMPATDPSETAANIPQMFEKAVQFCRQNPADNWEIWLASDMQSSNLKPLSGQWKKLNSNISQLPGSRRLRLLTFNSRKANRAITAVKIRKNAFEPDKLQISAAVHNNSLSGNIRVKVVINKQEKVFNVLTDGNISRFKRTFKVATDEEGYGSVSIPDDNNMSDNKVYFAYEKTGILHCCVVADRENEQYLALSVSPSGLNPYIKVEKKTAAFINPAYLSSLSLLIWQVPLPTGQQADWLSSYIRNGGQVLFLPPAKADTGSFHKLSWKRVHSFENPAGIPTWIHDYGPLANTSLGEPMQLNQVRLFKKQSYSFLTHKKTFQSPGDTKNFNGKLPSSALSVVGTPLQEVYASCDDNSSFLSSSQLGKGRFWACSTLPGKTWSNLAQTTVFLPMIQRLLMEKQQRSNFTRDITSFTQEKNLTGGKWLPLADSGSPFINAGVYQKKGRYIALNIPEEECYTQSIPPEHFAKLLNSQTISSLNGEALSDTGPKELWRGCVLAVLICLLVEAILALPNREGI